MPVASVVGVVVAATVTAGTRSYQNKALIQKNSALLYLYKQWHVNKSKSIRLPAMTMYKNKYTFEWKWIEAIKYEPHNLKFPIQIWLKLSANSRFLGFGKRRWIYIFDFGVAALEVSVAHSVECECTCVCVHLVVLNVPNAYLTINLSYVQGALILKPDFDSANSKIYWVKNEENSKLNLRLASVVWMMIYSAMTRLPCLISIIWHFSMLFASTDNYSPSTIDLGSPFMDSQRW